MIWPLGYSIISQTRENNSEAMFCYKGFCALDKKDKQSETEQTHANKLKHYKLPVNSATLVTKMFYQYSCNLE